MPVPSVFGVLASGGSTLAPVGGASITATNGTYVLPNVPGLANGDFVMVIAAAKGDNVSTPAGGTGSGWAKVGYTWIAYPGFYFQVWYKNITNADRLAFAGGTMTLTSVGGDLGTAISVVAYSSSVHTAAILNNSGEQASSTTTLTNSGITRAGASKFLVGVLADRAGQIATTPSGFTSRTTQSAILAQTVVDRPSSGYVDGTAVNWAIASNPGQSRISFLLELT